MCYNIRCDLFYHYFADLNMYTENATNPSPRLLHYSRFLAPLNLPNTRRPMSSVPLLQSDHSERAAYVLCSTVAKCNSTYSLLVVTFMLTVVML